MPWRCGKVLGLLAFAVAVFAALAGGNTAETALLRGIWAMVLFCALGSACGWVAERVIDEHARQGEIDLERGESQHSESQTAAAGDAPGPGEAAARGSPSAL